MHRKRIATPDGSTTLTEELSRRGFLERAARARRLGAAGPRARQRRRRRGQRPPGERRQGCRPAAHAGIDIHADGGYTTLPLVKDSIRIGGGAVARASGGRRQDDQAREPRACWS